MKTTKINKKNIRSSSKALLILSLGFLAHAGAQATESTSRQTCDISVEADLIEHSNEQVVEHFRGSRDRIGRDWRETMILTRERDENGYLKFLGRYSMARCAESPKPDNWQLIVRLNGQSEYLSEAIAGPIAYEACQAALREYIGEPRFRLQHLESARDHSWDEVQREEVVRACNERLERDHADTLLTSNGGMRRSREYYCTGPLEVLIRDGKFRAWESRLVRFTPVYSAISDLDFTKMRCEKIRGCTIRAQTGDALREASDLWIASGCELLAEENLQTGQALSAPATSVQVEASTPR